MSQSAISISEKIKFIESVFGAARIAKNAKNVEVSCPVCIAKNSVKKKLAILVDNFMNHCWICGWRSRSLAPLLRKYSTVEKFNEYVSKFVPDAERNRKTYQQNTEPTLILPSNYRLLVNAKSNDPNAIAAWKYALSRGLTQEDLWYYKIGTSDEQRWSRRLIVPSFDSEGDLNYYVARAIDPKRKPKYDNPDFDKLPIIFNEVNIDWSKRLVLCEGAFDMFKCGQNVVPLLGSDINEQSKIFNEILVRNTPIAIALDDDMWETKTVKMAKKLNDYNLDVVIVDTRSIGDPGKASKSEFKHLLEDAKKVSWESMFLTKLSRATRTSLRYLSHRYV